LIVRYKVAAGCTGACKIIAQLATVSNGVFFSVAVVNVKKKHTQCKYATLCGYETVAQGAIILHTPVVLRSAIQTWLMLLFSITLNMYNYASACMRRCI
jgi:hypothetical protein